MKVTSYDSMFKQIEENRNKFIKEKTEEFGTYEAYEEYEERELNLKITEAKKKAYKKVLSNSGIPIKYQNSCIRHSSINQDNFNEIKKHKFVYIRGKLGRGKTSIVCAYLKLGIVKFLRNYGDVDYPHFDSDFKPYFLKCHSLELMDLNELKKYLNDCSRDQVLVIDDIGFVKSNDFIRRNIASMILDRMDNNKKTIITSNESMTNIFDERIVNKMKEDFKMITLDGENLRVSK